jgi:hypothetical protein
MSRILPQLYTALYLSIFVGFARKIIDKATIMFDECVPIVNEDDNGWYGVRLFHRYFIYGNMCKENARKLAMIIYKDLPVLRGHIEVVQHEDPEEVSLPDIPELSKDTVSELYEIWEHFEDD